MPAKAGTGAPAARRAPQQARALHKVEIILEAAVRLIERGDIESLTTNALAGTAGISIGTLYQYFDGKQAVLAALIEREMAAVSARVLKSLEMPVPEVAGERVRAIVRAVLDAYGGRKRAHRLLLQHAMTRGDGGRLAPMYGQLIELFSVHGVAAPGLAATRLSAPAAFVLTHAVAGVLRAWVATSDPPRPREQVEDALVQLIIDFLRANSRP